MNNLAIAETVRLVAEAEAQEEAKRGAGFDASHSGSRPEDVFMLREVVDITFHLDGEWLKCGISDACG